MRRPWKFHPKFHEVQVLNDYFFKHQGFFSSPWSSSLRDRASMMSILDAFLTFWSQFYFILVNFRNFGEHSSEVSWHVQWGNSKFKVLEQLSLAIRLSIYWVFHGPPLSLWTLLFTIINTLIFAKVNDLFLAL